MCKIKYILLTLCLLAVAPLHAVPVEPGVSLLLAEYRKAHVSDVGYQLSFSLRETGKEVECQEEIRFTWTGGDDLQLDFQGTFDGTASVNGKRRQVTMTDEHIIIPAQYLRKGKRNSIRLTTASTSKSLNHHGDYLYTLLVPAQARSVFACFDQPDLKARFTLTLTMPSAWTAISNAPVCREETAEDNRKTVCFEESDLLPTYLFSFTAGRFQRQTAVRDGYWMEALYRETDSAKVAQLDKVFDEVALSLRWLEDYTGIRQPFRKYGFAVLPGYQFGGMEHPGAIQYTDREIFLGPHPTPDEELRRLQLIAHETAHLWFGDLVTMRWFNDVWTKEVFANFMADKITREQFTTINHDLNFLKSHYVPALRTDRTDGTHPIQQPLENLSQAGLLYGNIIYHKAPIMMRKLEEQMGETAFREGIRQYLRAFSYGNATWDALIEILDSVAPTAQLKDFDRQWVKGKGVTTVQVGNLGAGEPLPNLDGRGYARYAFADSAAVMRYTARWPELQTEESRMTAALILYDNYLMHKIPAESVFPPLLALAEDNRNDLTLSVCASLLTSAMTHTADSVRPLCEQALWQLSRSHPVKSFRQVLTQSLGQHAVSPQLTDTLYQVWRQQADTLLNERDYMRMAYHLAIVRPGMWREILSEQRQRLTSADRQKEFDYISRACVPDTAERRQLFEALIQKENRVSEPWARSLLTLLCDESRAGEAIGYITPGLEALAYIQRTSDIFFPSYWLNALLGSRDDAVSRQLVRQFIDTHPDYMPALMNKLKEAAYPCLNAAAR